MCSLAGGLWAKAFVVYEKLLWKKKFAPRYHPRHRASANDSSFQAFPYFLILFFFLQWAGESALYGTMLHSLFERALETEKFDVAHLTSIAEKVVAANLIDL